jgi:hypothetical protein
MTIERDTPSRLRDHAAMCRRVAPSASEEHVRLALLEMAAKYEERAARLEQDIARGAR